MTTVKLNDWPDSIYTRTICQCTDSRCDLDISIDVDATGNLELGLQTKMRAQGKANWDAWFWVDWWWRVKTAVKLLFVGYVEMDHYILLNEKGLKEFRDSLEESINAVETHWAEKDKKKKKE